MRTFALIFITFILHTHLVVFLDLVTVCVKISLRDVYAATNIESAEGKLLLEFFIIDLHLLFRNLEVVVTTVSILLLVDLEGVEGPVIIFIWVHLDSFHVLLILD